MNNWTYDEVFAQANYEGRATGDQKTEQMLLALAEHIKACENTTPFAFVAVAPNGNVRLWSGQQTKIPDFLAANGLPAHTAVTPLFTHPADPARAAPEPWRSMETAPRDGTMLRLLVQFEDHATEDTNDPAPTIGAYANGADELGWVFAGWCWTHDHFTQGLGVPVGWLPMLSDQAAT